MEKSIGTLKASTAKIQSKQKLNINKRRHENNHLIRDLDAVRSSKRMNQVELEKKKLTIQKLKLDKQKRQREFDKKLAIIEQETLNKVKAHGLMGAGNQNSTDMKDPNDQFDEDEIYKKAGVDADFFSGE
jgi:Icc-related predicted phosphoesterase